MTSISSRTTCHNRWCPLPFGPWTSLRCKNLSAEFGPNGTDIVFYACCKLHCEPHSQLLQLQCQGTSATIAMATWVIVITLMVCAAVFVVAFPMERGFGRKVAVLGGVLYFSFAAVIAFVFGGNENLLDTPLYPIIGAMNVATFSYLFSGYQYSISLVYELASAATLVFTMIPVWSLLTTDLFELINGTSNVSPNVYEYTFSPTDLQWRSATAAGRLAVAMLCVSIMWVVHSSLFRTVGYMAAWIGAFTSQKKEAAGSEPKNLMRHLWVLAAGDGHPTWRTPVGQAMGLYLVFLSWGVSLVSQIYLNKTCYDDLILLRMMMWFPPSLLTLVVIINQSVIFVKSTACLTADMTLPGKTWKETQEFYTKAVIIYRLGRKGMDVNVDREYKHRQDRGKRTDKALAFFVIVFEVIFFVVAWVGFYFFKVPHLLLRKIIPYGIGRGSCCWQGLQTCECEAKRRKAAFKILCDHCGEKSILRYNLRKDGSVDADIKADVRRLLGAHLDKIDLPLLLDNIDPSGLLYILEQLEQLVALPSESALIMSNDQVLNSPRDQVLETIRISKGTSFGSSRSAAEKVPQPFDSSFRSSRSTTRFAKEGAESLLPKVELGTDDQTLHDESQATANGTSEPEITELPQPSSAPQGSPVSLQRSDSESGSGRLFRRRASSKRVLGEEPLVRSPGKAAAVLSEFEPKGR